MQLLCNAEYLKGNLVFKGENVKDRNYKDINRLVGWKVELIFLPFQGT
jgi:hypothetical protein